ncbi:MAG: hypothetical protein B9S33_13425 [Pedosphaera sp. Tous-C6FEB]|nr:MAG: hypothetical protein B9S33_13425 [Pedosphaera sp. Tous-C6FEB]
MCCFSRPVDFVRATKIFARAEDAHRQFLVYSMTLSAKEDLAMILPLPVRAGSGEKAVTFINLEEYPQFFADLEKGFPELRSLSLGPTGCATTRVPAAKLEVVQVGSFEASFVPTIADFARLDERFRLPVGMWERLPAYRHYGFAVFKLKPGARTVHPMAFSFPRANIASLFFPTVHIHDGKVHERAGFDHVLYCQRSESDVTRLTDWRESPQLARDFVKMAQSKGLVAADRHCHRKELRGQFENRDVWV